MRIIVFLVAGLTIVPVSASAAVLLAQVSIPRERYPTRPLRLIVPYAPGGLDASSEQGSRLRDANDGESAAAAVLLAQVSIPRERYPTRPLRLIVPYAPGGGNDIMARAIGARLGEAWSQQVIIDNRPGANGLVACEITATAAPDGYTLLMANIGSHAINPALYKKFRTTR